MTRHAERWATLAVAVALSTSVTAQKPPKPTPVQSGFGAGAYVEADITPTLVHVAAPVYTAEALKAGIEGDVQVEAVVLTNGTVGDVRVVRSLDTATGLDDNAMVAARKFTFQPASLDGKPVRAIVALMMTYHLHSPGSQTGPPDTEAGLIAPSQRDGRGGYKPDTPGLVSPKLTHSVEPRYTSEAMRQKIEGSVTISATVKADGSIGDTRVVTSLDARYGLDQQAMAALKQWTFIPGRLNGRAVPTTVTIVLTFRLH